MAAYISKSEQETLEALRQAEREIKTQKMKTREAIYKIAHAFAKTRKFQFRKQHTYVYQSNG